MNSEKYEKLMAMNFIPELSVLERRITELSKMPEQLKSYVHHQQRVKKQENSNGGVTSILKTSKEED